MRITYGAVLLLLLSLSWSACKQTSTPNTTSPTAEPVQTQPNLPFTKEGEAFFPPTRQRDTLLKLDMEIANTDYETETGLMFRSQMKDSESMLFIFEAEEPRAFWMKNTYVPLDIIFIGANKRIVSIQRNAAPLNEKSLPSDGPAQFVLEVKGGYCDKHNIQAGDFVDWKPL